MKCIPFILLMLLTQSSFAQDNDSKEGQWYVYWGWNWSGYTQSDIRFEGNDHDFVLHDVIGEDRQTMFTLKKYFHPEYFTTPQYNVRIGKYLKNNWDVSFGIDHMKYVVRQNQPVKISGRIDGSAFEGLYDNTPIDITRGLLLYEHTDGLNYVNFSLRKNAAMSKEDKKLKLDLLYGIGTGLLVPRSDVTLLGKTRHDNFHFAGYGVDLVGGFRFTFKDRLFFQTEFKAGFINLPDVRTTVDKATKASQNFAYYQYNILFGGNMFLKKSRPQDQ